MGITLTESAVERARSYIAKKPDAVGLRLGVRRTGCSGFAYDIDYARETGADDTVFEQQGVRVVVDHKSLSMLDGVEVDFGGDELSQSFKFRNPNIKDECGCGESFTV